VQLDVHAEVVRIELELVAGGDALVFVDVERQRGDLAVEGQLLVVVSRCVGVEADHVFALLLRSSRVAFRDRPEVSRATSARA